MAKLLFTSAPLPGHLDWGGFLATAQAAQSMGHSVRWVSGEPLRQMVEAGGIEFKAVKHSGWRWPPPPLPGGLIGTEVTNVRYKRALDTWLDEELVGSAVEYMVEAIEEFEPDVIANEPFLASVALAADVTGKPMAVCGWPAVAPTSEDNLLPVQVELSRDSQVRIERLNRRFSVEGTNWGGGATPAVQSPHLHISYFDPNWYEDEPPALEHTRYVGGVASPPSTPRPAWLDDLPPDVPAIFITLGSTFTGDLGFFSWAAQAAVAEGAIPIIALGGNPIADDDMATLKRSLPGGTRLLRWVDYDHVLPRCSLIIHHGGMGTTHAAILRGLLQVVVPHAADQRAQARRVAQAHIGLNLSTRDVQNGQLAVGVKALLADQRIIGNVAQLKETYSELGGASRAAQLLLELV